MKFDTRRVVRYWVKNAELKWETAKGLKRLKRNADCLFFCHLALECLLKALVCAAANRPAPYMHDLEILAKRSGAALAPQQRKFLSEANSFNLRARYDDYRFKFYKRATAAFTNKHFRTTNTMRLWLLSELQKKMQ